MTDMTDMADTADMVNPNINLQAEGNIIKLLTMCKKGVKHEY